MQMALHTLEGWDNYGEWVWPESALESCKQRTDETLEALRERLAQPELEWVGLTDVEVTSIIREWHWMPYELCKVIEAKLKEKNT
jgi:hypothetical protein